MKAYFPFIISMIGFSCCYSQTINHKQTIVFKLQKLIFHSSICYGTCPVIDLEIDSNRNISINREVYKEEYETDSILSGNFKGILDYDKYSHLTEQLQSLNIDSLKFPKIVCCDAPVITMIVYYNGKRKYVKSMLPPKATSGLISFLTEIGGEYVLPRTDTINAIEE
jgi:hypothetical protein